MKRLICTITAFAIILSTLCSINVVAADEFSVVSTTLTDNVLLENRSFDITFSTYVDTTTLTNGISVLDLDGNEIARGIYFETPLDNEWKTNTVKVKYGKTLVGDEYKLVIDSDLKSIDGVSCTEYEKNFTITGSDFFDDFSDDSYVVGEKPPTDGAYLFYSEGKKSNNNFEVMSEDGDKFIRLRADTLKKSSEMEIVFPKPITSDCVYIDMKVRGGNEVGGANVAPREMMNLYFNNAGGGMAKVVTMETGNIKEAASISGLSAVNGKVDYALDGFFHLGMEIVKENGTYKITVYNKNNESDKKLTINLLQPATALTRMRLININPQSEEQRDCYIDITEFSVKERVLTEVLHTNIGEISYNDTEFYVAFTDDVRADSFNNITLANSEGEEKKVTFKSYDEETDRAYFEIEDYLAEAGEYKLSLDAVKDVSGNSLSKTEIEFTPKTFDVEVKSPVIKDQAGENFDPATIGTTTSVVNVSFNARSASDETQTLYLGLVVFDSTGRIKKMTVSEEGLELTSKGQSGTLSASTSGVTLNEGDYIRVVPWSDSDKGVVLFAEPSDIR